jgi:hypothetical protein
MMKNRNLAEIQEMRNESDKLTFPDIELLGVKQAQRKNGHGREDRPQKLEIALLSLPLSEIPMPFERGHRNFRLVADWG